MNTTAEQVEKLESLIASAQALIQEIKQPALTREGWSMVQPNGTPPKLAPYAVSRTGCRWLAKESRDLVKAWIDFSAIDTMALRHRRSEGAIRSQLQHLLYAADIQVILDELVPPESAA